MPALFSSSRFRLDTLIARADAALMNSADDYRKLAAVERAAADRAELANRKAVHEQAAQVWGKLADQADTLAKRQVDRGDRPRGMIKPGDEPDEE